MLSNSAESLILREDQPASLVIGENMKPLTKSLSGAQLISLVREIATPAAQKQIEAKGPATFGYQNSDGVFTVKVMLQAEKLHVALAVDDRAAFDRQTGRTSVITGQVPVVTATAGSTDGAGALMDRLLRVLVEQSGSDLHLRVGEKPILRKHGEMVRIEEEATLDNTRIEAMLGSIMPERNRKEFAELNDTDFAHEITGIARYRANALRDR